jgi:hypothetical protein
MDLDNSLVSVHSPLDADVWDGKENAVQNLTLVTPASRTPGTMTNALTPSVLCNRDANPSPQRQKTTPLDTSSEEEKLAEVLKVRRLSTGFAEGVRRESFPGKYSHFPDISFNCGEHILIFKLPIA